LAASGIHHDSTVELPDRLLSFMGDSTIALTLADMAGPDLPLVAANDSFVNLTGYHFADVVGRNCRFLQPPSGAGPVRERIRAFIHEPGRMDERFLLANLTRQGRPFANLLYLAKLTAAGRVRFILGSQFDLTRFHGAGEALFERARLEDWRSHALLSGEDGPAILGTMRSLASSTAIIAQARLDDADGT
jgi:PAS domain S-box-containing protein